MTKKAVKLLSVLLAALLLVYLAYQIYMVAYPPYKTEIALAQTISDSVVVDGIVVRNETVIENTMDGIVNYLVPDGDKVAAGAAVADVYGSADAAANALRLELLQSSLSVLSKAADLGRSSGSNLNYIRSEIGKQTSAYASSLGAEDLSELAAYKDELTRLLNSFEMASGGEIDFTAAIAALQAEIAVYEASEHTASASVYTPQTGYFISTVDGYEGQINTENVFELDAAGLNDLLGAAQNDAGLDDSHCKVVSEYIWLYAAAVPKSAVEKFTVGASYTIDFNYAQVSDVPVKVRQVSYNEGDETGVVIFECAYLNPSITKLRCEQGVLSFTKYDGIKVARSAVRLVDGVQGVYIKYGSTVAFRKIDTVFETDEYILSRPGASDSEYLALYDEIIVEGKELYEGKDLGN